MSHGLDPFDKRVDQDSNFQNRPGGPDPSYTDQSVC